MKRFFIKSQLGQTSIEYLLMVVVAIGLGITFKKRMEEYLLKDGTGVFAKQLKSLEMQIKHDTSGRYRSFPLVRYK